MINPKLEQLFSQVQRPARYTGGELNSIIKEKKNVISRQGENIVKQKVWII